jgi:hypothetical protein
MLQRRNPGLPKSRANLRKLFFDAPGHYLFAYLNSGRVLSPSLVAPGSSILFSLILRSLNGTATKLSPTPRKPPTDSTRKRDLLGRLDDEIIDCADRVATLVDDGAADNLRGAVPRCQFLYIDAHGRDRLRRPLCQLGSGRKKPADGDRACDGKQLVPKLSLHLSLFVYATGYRSCLCEL